MTHLSRSFDAAREATKAAFHIRLIGTFDPDVVWAPADAGADAWLADAPQDFDQFPVRDGDHTIGFLVRGSYPGLAVSDAMRPLSEELIASADMPIVDLIPRMKALPYRLILRGDRIDGLVTQSDLLKLPVRVVVFGLLTHLETAMADFVSTRWPNESWLAELSAGRHAKLLEKEAALRKRGLNPPRIELTEFGDKRDLCRQLMVASERRRFEREMNGLRDLRDQLAHAATFLDVDDGSTGIVSFVDKCESARHWLVELMTLVEKGTSRGPAA